MLSTAYREFDDITDELVKELRQSHQLKVVADVESFKKKTTVRAIGNNAGLKYTEMATLYDNFYNVMYYQRRKSLCNESKMMDLESFKELIGSIASWAKIDDDYQPRQLKVANNFFNQLFKQFDTQHTQSLSFQVKTKIRGLFFLLD